MSKAIELLFAVNTISRKRGVAQQELAFFVLVENQSHDKQVEVHWRGEDETWQKLSAQYLYAYGEDREVWRAQAWFRLSEDAALPGNVRFALRCRMAGRDFWDNHAGADYTIEADSGIGLNRAFQIQHVDFQPQLQPEETHRTITIAVDDSLQPREVYIDWTTDGWRTQQRTKCMARRNYWDITQQSNARNPSQYGVRVYTARVRVRNEYRIEYVAGCRTPGGEVWDNNGGNNYLAQRSDFKVMILNLHCYQEADQDAKLSQIARAIDELDVDVVCLQEVAENWNDGHGDWNSNAAKVICDRLSRAYHLYTDRAHQGFDRYREGVAILSKYAFRKQESRYISENRDVHSIHSRKAAMGQIDVPSIGRINIFSAHLSWWQDGFVQQFDTLSAWAQRRQTKQVVGTLLCGDFNIEAGSKGYRHVVNTSGYEDTFLAVTDPNTFAAIFEHREAGWHHRLDQDRRIDYVYIHRESKLRPVSARVLFNGHVYGRVSDHVGYLVSFELL